jgi:hypothetical protein
VRQIVQGCGFHRGCLKSAPVFWIAPLSDFLIHATEMYDALIYPVADTILSRQTKRRML